MTKCYEIDNIRCGGCAATITKELSKEFEGVIVDIEGKKVTVEINNDADEEKLMAQLKRLGYPLKGSERGSLEDTMLKAKSFVSCAVGKFSDQ